jgi:hypothetical protein
MTSKFGVNTPFPWGAGDEAHWSDTDGGAGGSSEPNLTNAVFFTANSGNGAVTLTDTRDCLSLDTTGFTGSFSGAAGGLSIYGALTVDAATTISVPFGDISFNAAAGSYNVNAAGKNIATNVTFGGTGTPSYTLTGALIVTNQVQASASNLNTNNQTVTSTSLRSSSGSTVNINGTGVNVSTLSCSGATLNLNSSTSTCATFTANSSSPIVNMGSATLNCTTTFNITGCTFDEGTSIINYSGTSFSYTAAETFYTVNFTNTTAGSGPTLAAAATFRDLNRTNASGYTRLTLNANITATNSMNLAGNNQSSRRILVQSNTAGTARTITYNGASAATLTNVDVQDITFAGSGSLTLSGVGDAGGNTGISFAAPTIKYWVDPGSGTPNLSDNNWANSSGGGTAAANTPLLQDNWKFDANSFASGSRSVAVDIANYRVGSIDFTGVTNQPTFTIGNALSVYGSIKINTGVTLSGSSAISLLGRSSYNIASGGQSWGNQFSQNNLTGTYTLSDAFTNTSSYTVSSGNFSDAGFSITTSTFNISGSSTRSAAFSGTRTVTGTGTVWNATTITSLTFTDIGTIRLTNNSASAKTFAGGGLAYNNYHNATAGGGTVTLTGSSIFKEFKINGSCIQRFTAGTTTTVTTMTRGDGNATDVITISSATASAHNLVKTGGGVISLDYLNITNSHASPANTWYAGKHSVDNGGNTGWIFDDPPTAGLSSNLEKNLGSNLGMGIAV